ncbi:MAG: ABC transporter substrate-binding protein [Cyanobacteria bacterium P01_A01_bin.17]
MGNQGSQGFPQVKSLNAFDVLKPNTWGVKLFDPKEEKALQAKISLGEKIFFNLDNTPEKELGVERFRVNRFEDAAKYFRSSLKAKQNDPESLIYMNNASAAAAGNPIVIAIVVPIGSNVNVAKETLRGVAQYQHMINQQGGIRGRRLQVLIANDEDDPNVAENLATKLSQNPRIAAVVGHESSQAGLAAARIYNQQGVVMLSSSGYARELTKMGKFIFRTTPNSRVIADQLAQQASHDIPNARVTLCHNSQALDSRSFRDDFVAAIHAEGGTITHTACDFAASDFNPHEIPSQAVRDGATTLVLAPALKNLNQAIAVMQANQGRLEMLASHSMYTFDTLQKGRISASDMTLSVPWDASQVQSKTYAQTATRLWKGLGTWRTAMAYDATKVIVQGLIASTNRQGLQRALANPGFSTQGATGQISFLPTGDRKGQAVLVRILPGQRSGTGFDFMAFQTQDSSRP